MTILWLDEDKPLKLGASPPRNKRPLARLGRGVYGLTIGNSSHFVVYWFRLELKHAIAIGPGKADVLEWIEQTGSIAEAGRRLGMSYQRVWSLVRSMNQHFIEPLVEIQRGGIAGRGTTLTPMGKSVLKIYRGIESDSQKAVAKRLPELLAMIRADMD